MAAGLFRIKEILPSGLPGVIFQWTSAETYAVEDNQRSVRGGARAAPLGAWNQGGEMRSVRTEYTGNPIPSEQVQGSKAAPQEFNGRWDDRYNFKGFAQATLREFEALCKRGNMVEVSFQSKGYVGLLKNWNFGERTEWDIRYSFGLSIHGSVEEHEAKSYEMDAYIRKSPLTHRDTLDDTIADLFVADDGAPRSHMVNGPGDAIAGKLASLQDTMDALDDALDQRDLNVRAPANPINPFSYIASKFHELSTIALDLNQELLELQSSSYLAVVTGESVLDFEDWGRSLRFHSRILMGGAIAAETEIRSRETPEVNRVYRAYEGQSLMAISREVYGTPHQWGAIYEANGLTSEVLEEPELLIIPELGSA